MGGLSNKGEFLERIKDDYFFLPWLRELLVLFLRRTSEDGKDEFEFLLNDLDLSLIGYDSTDDDSFQIWKSLLSYVVELYGPFLDNLNLDDFALSLAKRSWESAKGHIKEGSSPYALEIATKSLNFIGVQCADKAINESPSVKDYAKAYFACLVFFQTCQRGIKELDSYRLVDFCSTFIHLSPNPNKNDLVFDLFKQLIEIIKQG